ncbi:TPA: zinc ABC transporter ATP-binding protein [Neisseria elongata]
MHNLFYCPTVGDDAERCLALAAALQNAPDFVFLEQAFAPEADIFCFIFLSVQKSFRFKCDFVYGQIISSGEHWTAAETAALEAAVNRIAEKAFQTAWKS